MSSKNELRSKGRPSLRLALRIARRDAMAHRARSVLIVLLIAIPIVGLSGIATVITSNAATPAETVRNAMGANQALLTSVSLPNKTLTQDPLNPGDWNISGSAQVDSQGTPTAATKPPTAYLPAGTRVLTLRDLAVVVKTRSGLGSIPAVQGQPWNHAFRGRFLVLSGSSPATEQQIMVSPAALARLGKTVGQSVTVTEPRRETFTIVGTMRDLTQPNDSEEIFARAGAIDGISIAQDISGTAFYLPDSAISWSDVQKLNRDGVTVLSRKVLLDPPPIPARWIDAENPLAQLNTFLILTPVLAFSLFEVALLAGAAFMVSTKQQERALATLASVGGDRRMLGRVVSAAGVVLGLAGGVLGSLVGIGAAWGYMVVTADGSSSRFPGFHVNPFIVLGIIVFALLAGWISALVPARHASRIDVVSSLRGSARPVQPSRRAPLVGILVALLGIVLTVGGTGLIVTGYAASNHELWVAQAGLTLIVIGPILTQVAALIVAPAILRAVARALSRVGTAARLASRDIARNASRSVPALGAIMSTIFVASFLMTYTAASQAEQTADYEYSTAQGLVRAEFSQSTPSTAQLSQLTSSIRSTLNASNVTVLRSARRPGENPKPTDTFAVPALNSAARCTQLMSGPTPVKPGSVSIASADCQGPTYVTDPADLPHIWVASPTAIARAIGAPLTADSRAALADGKVVAFYPEFVRDGAVRINWWTYKQYGNLDAGDTPDGPGSPARSESLSAVVQLPPKPVDFDMVMSPQTATAAGIRYSASEIIAKTNAAPTESQLDSLNATSQAIGMADRVYFSYESGPSSFATIAQWTILILAEIIAIAAAAIALGLARAEGRRDERVLGSLGAPPPLRRAFGFWSAAVLAGVGSIGGVLLGTVPALAVSQSLVQEGGRAAVPFTPPWLALAIAAIGLPLLLSGASWLAAGRSRTQYNVRAPIE